ncbi:MAG: hypothetical protein DMD79_01795 [Candidatus Rokuibacteriota bacterium]|nr:MAG: hypothetical protein DMD79_01795 [Candidatus Rokubacteria bacterium]
MTRVVGALGVASLLAAAFTSLPSAVARRLEVPPRIEPADAIVALGGDIGPDATLVGSSLRRAVTAIVLERRSLAPLLVFSGVRLENGAEESEARAKLARSLGVPGDRIVTVLGARNTREEAIRVAATLRVRGARRILLVTDSLHLVRARALFEQAGLQVLPAPTDDRLAEVSTPSARVALALHLLQEGLARLYYRVAGYST